MTLIPYAWKKQAADSPLTGAPVANGTDLIVGIGYAQMRTLGSNSYQMEIAPRYLNAGHIRRHEAARVAIARARKRGWKVYGGKPEYPLFIQEPGKPPIKTTHFGLVV